MVYEIPDFINLKKLTPFLPDMSDSKIVREILIEMENVYMLFSISGIRNEFIRKLINSVNKDVVYLLHEMVDAIGFSLSFSFVSQIVKVVAFLKTKKLIKKCFDGTISSEEDIPKAPISEIFTRSIPSYMLHIIPIVKNGNRCIFIPDVYEERKAILKISDYVIVNFLLNILTDSDKSSMFLEKIDDKNRITPSEFTELVVSISNIISNHSDSMAIIKKLRKICDVMNRSIMTYNVNEDDTSNVLVHRMLWLCRKVNLVGEFSEVVDSRALQLLKKLNVYNSRRTWKWMAG